MKENMRAGNVAHTGEIRKAYSSKEKTRREESTL